MIQESVALYRSPCTSSITKKHYQGRAIVKIAYDVLLCLVLIHSSLMASKAFTSSLAESDSTSGDEWNGSTEWEELECEDEPNTWTVVDRLKINRTLREIASCRLCGDGVLLRLQNFPRILLGYFRCEPFGESKPCVSLVGGMTQLTAALMRCDKL